MMWRLMRWVVVGVCWEDSIQMPCNSVFDHDVIYGYSSTLWKQPPVCWTGWTSMGLGGGYFFHLVRGFRHGRNLLLFSCKFSQLVSPLLVLTCDVVSLWESRSLDFNQWYSWCQWLRVIAVLKETHNSLSGGSWSWKYSLNVQGYRGDSMEFCIGVCANNQVGVNISIEGCDTSWVWEHVALVYSFCKSQAQVWK